MSATIIKASYLGPTNFKGSRYVVTNMRTGERKTVSYDYSARSASEAAVRSFCPTAADVVWGGEDLRGSYYVVDLDA